MVSASNTTWASVWTGHNVDVSVDGALTRGMSGAQEVQRCQQDTDDAGETQARRGGARDSDGHDTRVWAGRTQAGNAQAKVGVNVCSMDTKKALGVRGEDA